MATLRRALIPQSVRDTVKARLTIRRRPALDESSVARLESIFDEDLRALSNWLNVDLNCRNFDEKTSSNHLDWAG